MDPTPRACIPVNEAEAEEPLYYELKTPGDVPTYSLEHDAKIIGWRCECFLKAGFEQDDALAMALRRDVDRERVESLVRNGSSHLHAALIVL